MAVIISGDITEDRTDILDNTTGDVVQVTATIAVRNGARWTLSIGVAVKQSDLFTVQITGLFDINIGNVAGTETGGLTADGADGTFIIFESNAAFPANNAWGLFRFRDTLSSSFTYCEMKDSTFGCVIQAEHTTDNLTVDKIIFTSCQSGFAYVGAGVQASVGSLEYRNNAESTLAEALRTLSSNSGTIDRLFIHDCADPRRMIHTGGTGKITITHLLNKFCECTEGLILTTVANGDVQIDNLWWKTKALTTAIYNDTSDIPTIDINGGVVDKAFWALISAGTEQQVDKITIDKVDFYGRSDDGVAVRSGLFGLTTPVYAQGGGNGIQEHRFDKVETSADQDGIADNGATLDNSDNGVFNDCNGIRLSATPNFPQIITSPSLASVSDNEIRLTATINKPASCYLVWDIVSRTVNKISDLDNYIGGGKLRFKEEIDYSLNGELVTDLTPRTLIEAVTGGQTIFARMVAVDWFTDEVFFSDEVSVSVGGAAAAVGATQGSSGFRL